MDGLLTRSTCANAAISAVLALALSLLPTALAARDGGWQIDPRGRVEAGIVNANASTRDDQFIVVGDATYVRGQVALEVGNDDTAFEIEFDRIMVQRFEKDRPNTDRDRYTAAFEQGFGDFAIRLQARQYDDLVTPEFNETDETGYSVRLQFEPERAHRIRLGAGWRKREYDDGDGPDGAASKGDGARLEAGYRYRFGRYHYIHVDLGAEKIASTNPRRGFSRREATLSYTHPLNRSLRVRPALAYRDTRFAGRLTVDGEMRTDRYLTPEIEVLWWKGSWRVEAEAKYVTVGSNDPVRDRQGRRLTLSVGHVF